jgi:hypothetical protein
MSLLYFNSVFTCKTKSKSSVYSNTTLRVYCSGSMWTAGPKQTNCNYDENYDEHNNKRIKISKKLGCVNEWCSASGLDFKPPIP